MKATAEPMEARVAATLEAYDAQGWHRTGTAVDINSAFWLVGAMRNVGSDVVLEEFELFRPQPVTATIEIDGRCIEGLPLFDTLPLPGGCMEGALGPLGSSSPIGVLVTRSPAPDERYDAIRRETGHQALVAITVGRTPGLHARNAVSFKHPFGVPVLQVSSEEEAFLLVAADAGTPAKLCIVTESLPARSANVVARVAGTNPSLEPIVVSTPRSGWWNCSGERGGGLACWLDVLRSAVAEPLPRDALFAAFAGHEIDHVGLDSFLERRPGIATRVHAWVHFGANVGAAVGPSVRVSASRVDDLAQARTALKREGVNELTSPPAGVVNGGESAVVAGLGARCIALLGGSSLFHLESDRWPRANDVPQTARQARAFSAFIRTIATTETDA